MDESRLLPENTLLFDPKFARKERRQRFKAFAKEELDYYEQSKLVLAEEDETFFEARQCCDRCFFGTRVVWGIFVAVAVLYLASPRRGKHGSYGSLTPAEIAFHHHLNQTYCFPTYGWVRSEQNPNCEIQDETTCDTNNFVYDLFGEMNSPDCCKCKDSRWGPQCQFQCVGTINITNATGTYEKPCNNHGSCDSGALGTGQCFCDTAYWASAGDCEPIKSILGDILLFGSLLFLGIIALMPPYAHFHFFQLFFRCKRVPTILVENELAMGEIPWRVSVSLYISVYGGMFVLILMPQLTHSDSIGTIQGIADDSLDMQLTVSATQTFRGYLSCIATFVVVGLSFFSIWDLFSSLIKLTSEKGDIAQDLRMQRKRLNSQVRQLQQAWTIPIADIDIGQYLAQGSYGKVSRARWSCLPQIDVVVKEIFPNIMSVNIDPETGDIEETGLFEDAEMQAMLRLRHRHLALFFGAGKMLDSNHKFLVFEYCSHGDLFSYIERANKDASLLTQVIVNRLLLELCSAMIFMHSQKFIHRDLKPQNILLQGKELTIKVCDFGLARIFKEGKKETMVDDMEDSTKERHRGVSNRSQTCSFAAIDNFGCKIDSDRGFSDVSKSTTALSQERDELSISVVSSKEKVCCSSEEKENRASSRIRRSKIKKASLANLVKARDERVNMEDMKMTGRVGTVPYMAPELFMINVHYCKMVDVFAFGIILWELLVGERVWKDERLVSQIAKKVVAGERPSLDELNSCKDEWKVELLPLLKKCWADEAYDRMSFKDIELILQQ